MSEISKLGKGVAIAESSRDKKKLSGPLASIFSGQHPFSHFNDFWSESLKTKEEQEQRDNDSEALNEIMNFLETAVDPQKIEDTQEISDELLVKLSKVGFFALKVPRDRGGKGLSQEGYTKAMGMITSYCEALGILASADNTIGAKFPVLYFGTEEQKSRFLPELMKHPSGFCFTEKEVGSDPANMSTYAMRVKDDFYGDAYSITGQKWYTTNPQLAEYLAVVAKIVNSPEEVKSSECFGIFIVPTRVKGVDIGPRNEFIGMRGIYNANPKFDNVIVPALNLIGGEGNGFRIAMKALNTGRIAISGSCVATAKAAFNIMTWWGCERKQWGQSIGCHELIGSGMLAPAACRIFAMEAMTEFAANMVDCGQDSRLEAAAAKIFNSEMMWQIVNDMIQIRGGQGYETAKSLSRRVKFAPPTDRIWRSSRPNTIFEGSTQILSQWLVREGVPKEYEEQGGLAVKKEFSTDKIGAYIYFAKKLALSYIDQTYAVRMHDRFAGHLEFIESRTRKLNRDFLLLGNKYGMGRLARKQLTISRLSWIAMYLFAMSATCFKASNLDKSLGHFGVIDFADLFCDMTEKTVDRLFEDLRDNDDNKAGKLSKRILVLSDEYNFLTEGIIRPVPDDLMAQAREQVWKDILK